MYAVFHIVQAIKLVLAIHYGPYTNYPAYKTLAARISRDLVQRKHTFIVTAGNFSEVADKIIAFCLILNFVSVSASQNSYSNLYTVPEQQVVLVSKNRLRRYRCKQVRVFNID